MKGARGVVVGLICGGACATAALATKPLSAQQVTGTLADDLGGAWARITALAEAIPEADYSWRPAEGVRSVAGVLMHVAASSFVVLERVGAEPGADGTPAWLADPDAVTDRAAIFAALANSLTFADTVLRTTRDEELLAQAPQTVQGRRILDELLLLNTHTHEHLGQLIAYARSLGVVPPWSR